MALWVEVHCDAAGDMDRDCAVISAEYPGMLMAGTALIPHLIKQAEKAGWWRETVEGRAQIFCPACAKRKGFNNG